MNQETPTRREADFKSMSDREVLLLINQELRQLSGQMQDLTQSLFGDGNGNPGLRMRVVLLEQRLSAMMWVGSTVGAAVLIATLSFLWGLLTGQIVITYN